MKILKKSALASLLACSCLAVHAAAPASVVITGGGNLTNTCSSNFASVNVTANNSIYPLAHDNFILSGGGQSYTWNQGEQTSPSYSGGYGLGDSAFWGFAFPANTVVTATIYTYATSTLSNPIYSSAIRFNCTTGEVLEIVNTDLAMPVIAKAPTPVPAVGTQALLLSAIGIIGAAGYLTRRRKTA